MFANLKKLAREFIPQRYQVPVKYWYAKVRGVLEEELDLLDLLVGRNDLVIDVGGNRGIYSYKLWKLGTQVEVFEPNPSCHTIMKSWADNKTNVRVHPIALSNRAGSTNLHIPVDDSGIEHDASASIEHANFKDSREQLVELKTLDSFGFENVVLIKIDVEGHEYNVIDGAATTIISSRPALLVEIEQRHISIQICEVFERILNFGYQGYFMERGALSDLDDFEVDRHQSMECFGGSKKAYTCNFLFLHRERLENGDYCALINKWVTK